MRFSLIVIIATAISQSCSLFHPKWVDSMTDRRQPQRSELRLSKQQLLTSPMIDTGSVYLCKREMTLNGEPQLRTIYEFMRFSKNGTAFISGFFLETPTDYDYNDLISGQFCLYTVDGETIKIESYDYSLKNFEIWSGKVERDKIILYESKGRGIGAGKSSLNHATYERKPAKLKSIVVFPD